MDTASFMGTAGFQNYGEQAWQWAQSLSSGQIMTGLGGAALVGGTALDAYSNYSTWNQYGWNSPELNYSLSRSVPFEAGIWGEQYMAD